MTERIRCLECAELKLNGSPLAEHRFGNCKHEPEWRYRSVAIRHDCEKFQPAADDVQARRIEWFNNRRKNQ